jgi:hypothetical protein
MLVYRQQTSQTSTQFVVHNCLLLYQLITRTYHAKGGMGVGGESPEIFYQQLGNSCRVAFSMSYA